MRVLVVSALVATLAGCSTSQQMSADHTSPTQSTLTRLHHRIVAGTKKNPGYHKRASGNTKTAPNTVTGGPHPSDLDDKSVAEKVRQIIASKLGDPASLKFPDLALGKAAHSVCGVAEVKAGSGQTKELPFVYLVRKNEAYIIDGSDDLRASTAIHKICD